MAYYYSFTLIVLVCFLKEEIILDWAIRRKDGFKLMKGNGPLSKETAYLVKKFSMEEEIDFIKELRLLEKHEP